MGCVIRERTVVIRASFEIVYPVPEDWSKENIEGHLNESGWCKNNILVTLNNLAERAGCLCQFGEFEYIREATKIDEEVNKLFIDEIVTKES